MENFFRVFFSSIESGSIYALVALGIVIIFRTSVTTNFAQGSIAMFNAFIAAFIFQRLAVINNYWFQYFRLPVWISVIIAIICALILGMLIDFLIIRNAKKAGPIEKQIITLGLIILLLGISPWFFGPDPLPFSYMIGDGNINFGPIGVSYNTIFNIFVGLFIMTGLFFFLQYTKWGLAVRVTASNERVARLMGVPTKYVTMGAWALAAALGTLAALMKAPGISVSTSMMEDIQLIALIACILGGFQTFHGPVLGAYIIALTKNYLGFYVSSIMGDSILYILILIFIIFKPQGLIGKKIIKKV